MRGISVLMPSLKRIVGDRAAKACGTPKDRKRLLRIQECDSLPIIGGCMSHEPSTRLHQSLRGAIRSADCKHRFESLDRLDPSALPIMRETLFIGVDPACMRRAVVSGKPDEFEDGRPVGAPEHSDAVDLSDHKA